MKTNSKFINKTLTFLLMIAILFTSTVDCFAAGNKGNGKGKNTEKVSENEISASEVSGNEISSNGVSENQIEVIEIATTIDFNQFVDNCKLDSYSLGKKFVLVKDLNITGLPFNGIPYFNGTFDGNGHEISFSSIELTGTDYGFFRYIGKEGLVENLNLSGIISGSGTATNIGAFAGANEGCISNCSFEGSVFGDSSVGAIAGYNKTTGRIVSCSANGVVYAVNSTAGIAGTNDGEISACTNYCNINMTELEKELNIGGAVDLGSFNVTKNLVTRNNTGGIAGKSTGSIRYCTNYGTIGFGHTGYNVGGIAGSQSGILYNCINYGQVYGRKDVGGIVGQAEPYMEKEYLDDKIKSSQEDIIELKDSLSSINSSLVNAREESGAYVEEALENYNNDIDELKDKLKGIQETVSDNDAEAQEYIVSINKAIKNIDKITEEESFFKEYTLDDFKNSNKDELYKQLNAYTVSINKFAKEEQAKVSASVNAATASANASMNQLKDYINNATVEEIQDNLDVIYDNMEKLQESVSVSVNEAKDSTNDFVNQILETDEGESLQNIIKSVDDGFNDVMANVDNTIGIMDNMVDTVSNDIEFIIDNKDLIDDVSSAEEENVYGVISRCVNLSNVDGDINIGGIAGNMNIEYDLDPEFDFDFQTDLNISLRTSVKDVIMHCINYGDVTAKRDAVGGTVGMQEFGLVYNDEAYGYVSTEAGDYAGGIVGNSIGSVAKCYSFVIVEGMNYIGGIAGFGDTIEDCVNLSVIEGEGECHGAIAGKINGDGTVKNNFFSSDTLEAIDGISYTGVAEKISYEAILMMNGIPYGFHTVKVIFKDEDGIIAETSMPYGSKLSKEIYPAVQEKDGKYVVWEEPENAECVENNIIVTANYIPWVESLASKNVFKDGEGKYLILVEGKFYDDASLVVTDCDGPDMLQDKQELIYAIKWDVDNLSDSSADRLVTRLYVGENPENYDVYNCIDGLWTKTDSSIDGSYLVTVSSKDCPLAIIYNEPDYTIYYIAAGAVALLILILINVIIHKKKEKSKIAN